MRPSREDAFRRVEGGEEVVDEDEKRAWWAGVKSATCKEPTIW